MKFEMPQMEIILFEEQDVITLSFEQSGTGNNVENNEEGGWGR